MKALITNFILTLLRRISRLSWKSIYKLSDFFSYIVGNVVGYRKKVILENLRNSFPNYSASQIDTIAKKYYRNFTDIIFETIKLSSITKPELLSRFELNMQLLDQYYAQRKSAIIVTGHLGNWEMLNLFASVRFSHQMVIVYHELANQKFDNWFMDLRTKFGAEMVPMKEAFSKALEPRDKPFLFVLVNDQSPQPHKAYWTTFLEQETGVFRGAELIARKLNIPVLYMGILRNELKRGFYKCYFKIITENPCEEPNNAILQKQIQLLEDDIHTQPDNWLWSHRRWKHHKPNTLKKDQLLQIS
jgi:KDO2-lipid IV(A) lauroyltransferase